MYENIRKPGLLKDIPLLIIRALPSIYYYSKISNGTDQEKSHQLFTQNLAYLGAVIEMMLKDLKIAGLEQTLSLITVLKQSSGANITINVEQLTLILSDICSQNKELFRDYYRKNKKQMVDLYQKLVVPLKVLVTDSTKEEKLSHLLDDFCYYNIRLANSNEGKFSEDISKSDFVILTKIYAADVHQLVDRLNAFRKPGMVVVSSADSGQENKIALRHARQLMRSGFPVLFKIITPIRLFTTIEKTFLLYHNGNN